MSSINAIVKKLESQVASGNVDECKKALAQLKIAMLDAPASAAPSIATGLELGVLVAVADGDLEAFARTHAQLHTYYSVVSNTPRKHHILGLNLMLLLVENRLAEFHSQLELLSDADASNPFIQFPIGLERQLMVGIYDKVLSERIPDPSYQFFMDHLLQTVRDSIADCMEVSYKSLALKDAAAMMKFDSVQELRTYIQEERDDWILSSDGRITFQPPPATSGAADIPSMQWIQQSLTYATEMERIV